MTHQLQSHTCYRVETTAGRVLYLLFKDYDKRTRRLHFINLDPPYEDVPLRPRHITHADQIGATR